MLVIMKMFELAGILPYYSVPMVSGISDKTMTKHINVGKRKFIRTSSGLYVSLAPTCFAFQSTSILYTHMNSECVAGGHLVDNKLGPSSFPT